METSRATRADSYGIVFGDDAANSTQITKCSEVPALVGAACFKKF